MTEITNIPNVGRRKASGLSSAALDTLDDDPASLRVASSEIALGQQTDGPSLFQVLSDLFWGKRSFFMRVRSPRAFKWAMWQNTVLAFILFTPTGVFLLIANLIGGLMPRLTRLVFFANLALAVSIYTQSERFLEQAFAGCTSVNNGPNQMVSVSCPDDGPSIEERLNGPAANR